MLVTINKLPGDGAVARKWWLETCNIIKSKYIIVFALFRKVSSLYINVCVSLFKNTKHVIIPSVVYTELLQLFSNLQRR